MNGIKKIGDDNKKVKQYTISSGLHLYEDLRTALDPHSFYLSIHKEGDSSPVLIIGIFQTGSIFSNRPGKMIESVGYVLVINNEIFAEVKRQILASSETKKSIHIQKELIHDTKIIGKYFFNTLHWLRARNYLQVVPSNLDTISFFLIVMA